MFWKGSAFVTELDALWVGNSGLLSPSSPLLEHVKCSWDFLITHKMDRCSCRPHLCLSIWICIWDNETNPCFARDQNVRDSKIQKRTPAYIASCKRAAHFSCTIQKAGWSQFLCQWCYLSHNVSIKHLSVKDFPICFSLSPPSCSLFPIIFKHQKPPAQGSSPGAGTGQSLWWDDKSFLQVCWNSGLSTTYTWHSCA